MVFTASKKRQSEHRAAATVAGAFTIAGVTWVFLTDVLLYEFTRDTILIARIETAKGWTFIALTALLLYLVVLRSASRLTHAQATLAAVVESIADGVLLLGADRKIVHANPAALRMLHRTQLSDLIGMGRSEFSRAFRVSNPDGSLVPPDHLISQRVFSEGGPLHYKAVLHPSNGSELIISATAAAVRTKPGEPVELVVSVMHDITDSEHLEQLRDQFLAAAAHSLKTPIAIIKANVQVLSHTETAPRLRRPIAAIERQCGRIDRLVQSLLVFARARSKTLQLYPSEMELGPFVEKIADEMARATPEHEVRIAVAASPRIHADQERLAVVLRNLMEEAFRSSRSGAPLTVIVEQQGADAEIGVRYEPLPLQERSPAAFEEYSDWGISHSVAELLVKAHGGALREEASGSTTTSWIRLPVFEGPHGHA